MSRLLVVAPVRVQRTDAVDQCHVRRALLPRSRQDGLLTLPQIAQWASSELGIGYKNRLGPRRELAAFRRKTVARCWIQPRRQPNRRQGGQASDGLRRAHRNRL